MDKKKLKRNLTKAIRLALPGARIDWSQGNLDLLGEGPIAYKKLGKNKLGVQFQLQQRDDGFDISARILDGTYVFMEYGTVARLRDHELNDPHRLAEEIADSCAVEIHDLSADIKKLANLFRSSL